MQKIKPKESIIQDNSVILRSNKRVRQEKPPVTHQTITYVITFAREKGFYKGKDEDFSFRDAYCPIDFENVRYADAVVDEEVRQEARVT